MSTLQLSLNKRECQRYETIANRYVAAIYTLVKPILIAATMAKIEASTMVTPLTPQRASWKASMKLSERRQMTLWRSTLGETPH